MRSHTGAAKSRHTQFNAIRVDAPRTGVLCDHVRSEYGSTRLRKHSPRCTWVRHFGRVHRTLCWG